MYVINAVITIVKLHHLQVFITQNIGKKVTNLERQSTSTITPLNNINRGLPDKNRTELNSVESLKHVKFQVYTFVSYIASYVHSYIASYNIHSYILGVYGMHSYIQL